MKKTLLMTGLLAGLMPSENTFAGAYDSFNTLTEYDVSCRLVSGTFGQNSATYECTDDRTGITYTTHTGGGRTCSGTSCLLLTDNSLDASNLQFGVELRVDFDPEKQNTAKFTETLVGRNGEYRDQEGSIVTSFTYDHDITDYEHFNYSTGITQTDITVFDNAKTKETEISETYTNGKISGKSEINYYPDGETKMSETSETYTNGKMSGKSEINYYPDGTKESENSERYEYGTLMEKSEISYHSDGTKESEISIDYEWGGDLYETKYDENGIPISQIVSYRIGCFDENDTNYCQIVDGKAWEIQQEYEFDAQGNVTARWVNVPQLGDSCYMETDYDDDGNEIGEYEACEPDEDKFLGYYNRVKYSPDGKKIALYDNTGQLIESYVAPEPTNDQTTRTQLADGSYRVVDSDGKVHYEGKRIYTIQEANEVVGKTNTIKLRYK